MTARTRRRQAARKAARPTPPAVERAVVRQPPTFVSTYGEPNAEKVVAEYESYARLAFAGNAVVFAAINFRAKLFSEARFALRNLADKKLDSTSAEATAVLAKLVTPWPNGVTGDLLTRMEQDVSLAGNAYVRDCGDGRLERLRPDWVTIVSRVSEDSEGRQVREVVGYYYEPMGDTERQPEWYPVEEVAHWAPIPDPVASWRGMSWLTPVLREINADKAMTEHQDKFYRNAATPNIILKYAAKMTKSQKEGLADSVAARHGGPENAGGTLVLDEGADPMIVGSKFSDAEFTDGRAANENRIAVASGVPAMVIGLKEGLQAAAWSMFKQACRAVVDTTLRPNWRGACGALAALIAVPAGWELWFDTGDIAALQEGEAETAATMQVNATTASSFISAGFEPTSVINAIVAGDMTLLKHTGLVSVQLLPPGQDPNADQGEPEPKADPAAERASLVAEFEEMIERAWSPERAEKHKRDARGRFVKGSGVALALETGDEDALNSLSREQLRREAKKRGIKLKRGAPIDEIRDSLWDHHNGDKDDDERGVTNLRALQARQERIDVQREASIVAADIDEIRHKGADLELIQERLLTHAALLDDSPHHTLKGRRADIDALASQVRGLAGAKSVDAIQSDLRALQGDLGAKPVGKAGEKVSFDPQIHEPLAGDPQPGSEVEVLRPGSRSDDGSLLERPVVATFDAPTPAKPAAASRDRVLTEISDMAAQPGDLVAIARLRARMPELSHDEFTALLKRMDRERVIQLDPDPNRKALPPEAKAAAITIGGEPKHLVSIKRSTEPKEDEAIERGQRP